jgi:transposase
MPNKVHHVKLTPEEHEALEALMHKGEVQVRVYKRARILLLADEGLKDAAIMTQTGSSRATVARIRERYAREGAWAAIAEKPRSGRPSIFDGEARAKITALACSSPPEGRSRWDLRLLADKAVELCYVKDISHETVRGILKKTNSNRTSKGSGV